jgi:hypothetical protein
VKKDINLTSVLLKTIFILFIAPRPLHNLNLNRVSGGRGLGLAKNRGLDSQRLLPVVVDSSIQIQVLDQREMIEAHPE